MKPATSWFRELDTLLRGDLTGEPPADRAHERLRLRTWIMASLILGASYGVFMGLYAVLTRTPPCWPQLIATALKVPMVFLFTLVVTFPSLYVYVAIQMAWVLRPFVGHPDLPVSFFRPGAWGNAYVEVLEGLWRLIRGGVSP